MAATEEHRLTLDPMGKCSNAFVVSEKKAFEHFPIGSNVNLMSCGDGHLGFLIGIKNYNCVEDPLDDLLQILGFLFRYEIQNGGYGRI
jgi:hypothetical protein